MAEDVKIIAYDSGLSPATVTKTIHNPKFSFGLQRDIKVFDLGVFTGLMDDIFGGLKLPNYITDFGRSRKVWKINFQLVEGVDGDSLQALEEAAWGLMYFFDVTCTKYRYNKLEAGANITKDTADVSGSGAGAIYCRVYDFGFDSSMLDQGKIDGTITLWQGKIVRLF